MEERVWTADERQALAEGYCVAALLAEAARGRAEDEGDDYEAAENEKLAQSSWMMAEFGLVDLPESYTSYYAFDERIYRHDSAEAVAADRTEDEEKRRLRGAAMLVLSPSEQEIAELRFENLIDPEAIADMLKIDISTVRVHLRNIHKKWRKWLKSYEERGVVQDTLPVDEPSDMSRARKQRKIPTARVEVDTAYVQETIDTLGQTSTEGDRYD